MLEPFIKEKIQNPVFKHNKYIIQENCIFIFGQGLNLCVDNQIMLKG